MDTFIGTIILWPLKWVPQDWNLCDGTLLQIQQYQALYSLIGNVYGGSASAGTFALPDLRNRVPMGAPSVTQLSPNQVGSATTQISGMGAASVQLSVNNLPAHNHSATFNPNGGTSSVSIAIPAVSNPSNQTDTPGATVSLAKAISQGPDAITTYSSDTANTTLQPFNVSVPAGGGTVTTGPTGNGQPFTVTSQITGSASTIQPSLYMNYIICLNGLYPPRP